MRGVAVGAAVVLLLAAAAWLVGGGDAPDAELAPRSDPAPTRPAPDAPSPSFAAPTGEAGESRDEEVAADPRDPLRPPEGSAPSRASHADLSWGRVVDPWGEPIVGASVHASVPGFRGVGGRVVATAETGADGRFSFGIPEQRDPIRIDFMKDGYRRVRRDGPVQDGHVVLRPLRASRVEGRLVGPDGRPLPKDDLDFLFGRVGPDAPPPPFLERSAIVAVPDHSLGQPEVEREADVADDASFAVDQPPFFAGEVVLLFRGIVLARHAWKDGDPPIAFEVDARALRRALGRLVVEVEGEAAGRESDAPIAVDVRRWSPTTRRDEAESFELVPPGPLRVDGLPAGTYRVVVRDGDRLGRQEAAVPAGGSATARVALDGPARVRLRLRWVDADPMQSGQVRLAYRDAGGTEHDLDQNARSAGGAVFVSVEAPSGPGAFVFDGNVRAVDLAAGENADLDWTLRASRAVVLRAAVTSPSRADRPRRAAATVRLRTASGVPAIDRVESVAIAPDGTATLAVHAPPGRYRLELDFGELRRVTSDLEVTTDDAQEHVFPLP